MTRLLPALLALFVLHAARTRLVPAGQVGCTPDLWDAKPGRRPGPWRRPLVEHLEERMAGRWADPAQARLASALLVTAVALFLAGVVGMVGMATPRPALHLSRLASLPTGAAAAGPVAAPAPVPGPPSPATTLPAAPAPSVEARPEAAVVPVPAAPAPPAGRGGLPIGKGMWIWLHDRAEGGDPEAIVRRAAGAGLTHLYVRTGTLKEGFMGGPFLDRLLPVAHAHNLRVFGWDFPYLNHPGVEVDRAVAAIRYTTPDGHRIDGFSADIETTNEGTNNDLRYVTAYVSWLRQHVGPDYPLIATVPNPTAKRLAAGFPYAEVLGPFDAVAPMVYWMNRDPASDAAHAVSYLARFGKPVFPVGQAYDGAPEGGPPGVPGRDQLFSFLRSAEQSGAAGVSFWSWQHATQEAWDAIRDAGEFRLQVGGPAGEGLTAGMLRAYQTALTNLGFPVAADGAWGPATVEALLGYQRAARLEPTGAVDQATQAFLLAPVAAPVRAPG